MPSLNCVIIYLIIVIAGVAKVVILYHYDNDYLQIESY
ncbi:hypothetical protein HDE69_004075 [Pedobacter cryoconitis]|uniref:Uncharacterized protein n=1 Tax=Pedobacter cryoconitis TaxID=188932 RepID=A0A7W8YWS6_9SPHI|nr:hypothetical protein [Pedobacter cryoconitis]